MIQGRWFVLGAVVLGAGIAGILLWRYEGMPNPSVSGAPTPVISASPSPEKLLSALNDTLQKLDLLKLQNKAAMAFPVTVGPAVLSSIQEEFRLPRDLDPESLARLLGQASAPWGAHLAHSPVLVKSLNGDELYHCAFAYDSQWSPVEMTFIRVAAPKICLIIDDGGYQRGKTLEDLFAFKVPITVSIIPDVEFSKSLAEEFPEHGVEVMCHMPMEGHEKGAVGGDYKALLKKGMDVSKAKEEVEEALQGLPHCRGLNNHMGSVATEDSALMGAVCEVLKPRGLFVIDSRTTAQSAVEKEALKMKVPVARRNVFLDDREEPNAIRKQMGLLAAYAKRHGTAVGIGHFKRMSLEVLGEEVQKLKQEGFQFVYASEVVK